MESDTDYRLRIQQAFEGLALPGRWEPISIMVAVPTGVCGYLCHQSVSGLCHYLRAVPENNGVASEDLLAVVRNALNGRTSGRWLTV